MTPRALIDATLALHDPITRAQVARVVWWDRLAGHPCAGALDADMARWDIRNQPTRAATVAGLVAVGYSEAAAFRLTRGMVAQSRLVWLAAIKGRAA